MTNKRISPYPTDYRQSGHLNYLSNQLIFPIFTDDQSLYR
ncbi:hypothetical protein PORCRE_1929 [Porphyromonas crevioricanis JCM 15906]|uniref:Uncharacterized protein n=1 Tax=Porphyromonas crevioricanis JCM 15906 TaxID=1305617 RepID=T1DTH8_9PORP|nr:hypothetical protein PORCRE_1929 [Porphyromonas crevioricanis JCM 15906]